jgi:hypothetical protein
MKRPVVIGVVAVAVLIVVGAGIAFAVTSNDSTSGTAGSTTKHPTTTTKPSKSGSGTTSSTKSGSQTEPSTVDRSVPPDPKDAYQPVPIPTGISATIASCKWSSSNGGELEAAGTITNTAGEDDVWLITAVWLQHNQTQDEDIELQSDVLDLSVGQSKPWHLSISASGAPPDLSCALEIE